MDVDAALDRYLRNADVARWLFGWDPVRTVTPDAMAASFVYAIGWGVYPPGVPRTMNVEDMLIVTGRAGDFILGVIWGLGQPHVFAKSPLMLNKRPVARRFAVDFSTKDALEFMEFDTFEDGKIIVMFRQFIHTLDLSLPVVATARLHAPSGIEQTLGPVLMRADVFEAASCPRCGQVGKSCLCSFDSYAPSSTVRKSTYTWNQFTSCFMAKAQVGTIKMRITAILPGIGELRIVNNEVPVLNVLQKGNSEYINLCRTKAIHGLGITVIMPRTDTLVMAKSIENDFIDLHNSYVTRKRVRETLDPGEDDFILDTALRPTPYALGNTQVTDFLHPSLAPTTSDSIESVDDFVSIFPGMSATATSLNHPDAMANAQDVLLQQATAPLPEPELPYIDASFDPFGKAYIDPTPEIDLSPNFTATSGMDYPSPLEQPLTKPDLLDPIEDIFSPLESQTLTPPNLTALHDPIPLELLDTSLNTPNGLETSKGVWSSVVSSETSAREARVTQVDGSGKQIRTASRKKRAKRHTNETGGDDERKHKCRTCESRFKNRGDLLRHVKVVHEGKRMYLCETCGKSFGHSGHLNRHIQSVHLHQRRFKCQFCQYEFYQASHLHSHIGHIHGKKKTLSCKECGYRASSRNALKTHMTNAHPCEEVTMHGCAFADCPGTFENENELKNHISDVHGSTTNSNVLELARRR
ncbi:unnamed protein product [Chondrus crispus]|uniref:C2H2-type domain-containing protein n=1 Tax=Chondrus crispus TaxID=2769 RepID=R7QJ28_CHOCR|nr:unnamed protein product [Chondrus crispus]CDF38089.1 unnamed protein product [Chondrus crispus]|eukprot:XP_005717958.1 unnamed protein product [Chondrus crispus]